MLVFLITIILIIIIEDLSLNRNKEEVYIEDNLSNDKNKETKNKCENKKYVNELKHINNKKENKIKNDISKKETKNTYYVGRYDKCNPDERIMKDTTIQIRSCFSHRFPILHEDKDYCMEQVKDNGCAIAYIPKNVQTYDMKLEAVKTTPISLGCMSEQTLKLCLIAVERDPLALRYSDYQTK